METLILVIAIIVAAFSVYWYIKLMTKDNKSRKDIWISLLCFWGAFISVAIAYIIIIGKIGPIE